MSAAVKPCFTVAQADAIRGALRSTIAWKDENRIDCRAETNALRQLDAAHRDTLRRRRAR